MFRYLAITEKTATWLLTRPELIYSLFNTLSTDDTLSSIKGAEVAISALKIYGQASGEFLAIWNSDYLSGTGIEGWSFIKLTGEYGIFNFPEISKEVFEREIHVSSLRLRNYRIETSWFHRPYDNGAHTCTAGRGSIARQHSIAYVEKNSTIDNYSSKSLICLGPGRDFSALVLKCFSEAQNLLAFTKEANKILLTGNRPVLDTTIFADLKKRLLRINSDPEVSSITIPIVNDLTYTAKRSSSFLTYKNWIDGTSSLTQEQRSIINSKAPKFFPLRITGPAGSGKTLVMQLLAINHALEAIDNKIACKILFITHNLSMAQFVKERFKTLLNETENFDTFFDIVKVLTLSEYGRESLGIENYQVLDPDASQSKIFQSEQIMKAFSETIQAISEEAFREDCPILYQISKNKETLTVFIPIILNEISTVIKGHGLGVNEAAYVGSEAPYSRFHGILNSNERRVVFNAFEKYSHDILEMFEVLDPDDVSLSMLGRLKSPIWRLKRKELGYDYIFIDEAQLFNENEKLVFQYLSTGNSKHVPIVIALDKAQDPFSFSSAGLGTLGIDNLENENLPTIYRSTPEIAKLAFFIIQRTTDLFNSDFPDFTQLTNTKLKKDSEDKPAIKRQSADSKNFGRFIVKEVRKLRRSNLRSIAIICHSDFYFDQLINEFSEADLPAHPLLQRGEFIDIEKPIIVLTKPAFCGGQEFDAVIVVGLEEGMTPPAVSTNEMLALALEQKSLREMYLSFTRSRKRLIIALGLNSKPSPIIAEAINNDLVIDA